MIQKGLSPLFIYKEISFYNKQEYITCKIFRKLIKFDYIKDNTTRTLIRNNTSSFLVLSKRLLFCFL